MMTAGQAIRGVGLYMLRSRALSGAKIFQRGRTLADAGKYTELKSRLICF